MQQGRVLGIICLVGAGAVLTFWLFYFTELISFGQQDPLRRSFEAAFPIADAQLAATLLAAGIAALRRQPLAYFLLAIAAAQTLFLGLLDATFHLRHGFYSSLTGDALAGIALNVLCVVGGAGGLVHAARHWRVAAAGRAVL